MSRSPICECEDQCGQLAEEVHHRIDRAERPDLEHCLENLVSMTKKCHSKITRERQLKKLSG